MKRILSFLLVLATLLCAFPFAASAEDTSTATDTNGEAEDAASYLDLYVKNGLVSLFTAYEAKAASTAVTTWSPVSMAGKSGYTSYIEDAATLSGSWKYVDGALYSSYSGAYMDLSSLIAKVGTTYSIQTVYQMMSSKNSTTANIEVRTETAEDGTVTTKNVVTNYTSLIKDPESYTRGSYGLLQYGTLYAHQKYNNSNRLLFDCWFTQIRGGSKNYNMMFLDNAANNDNGAKSGTYYYTDANGAEQSFTAYRTGLPSHVQEFTVMRLGDAVAVDSKVNVSYKLYWQFYPSRQSSSAHSSHTLNYTASGTTDSSTVKVLSGLNANNYSVRVYNRELSTDDININHLADLCGFYGADVSALVKLDAEKLATVANALATVKLYHGADAEELAEAKLAFETALLHEVATVLGDASFTYLDLYVKNGLVSLFTAYDAEASETAVTSWASVALEGKAGYSSYINHTASLAGSWKNVDGALYSSYSGAYMELTPLIEKMGTTYSIQTVYQMMSSKNSTTANIEVRTETAEDGTVTTKNVVTNYTSLTSGAESYTRSYYGLLQYGTLYAHQKYNNSNRLLFDCWFTQIRGGSKNYNMMFLDNAANNDNGAKSGTYYYTDANGAEQSFTAYRTGLPSHVQEFTVMRLGDAVVANGSVSVDYKLYWHFYPNRASSSAHSSHTLNYTASGTTDSSTVKVLSGLNANNYSVRVYNRELSTEDINRNHLADLYGFYGINAAPAALLSATTIAVLAAAHDTDKLLAVSKDATGAYTSEYIAMKNALQAELNALAAGAGSTAEELTASLMDFTGYSFRVSGKYGLRALFSVDLSAMDALSQKGITVLSYGAVTAIETYNGKIYNTLDGLTVTLSADGAAEVTEGIYGAAIINSRDTGFKFLSDDGEARTFAYTVTYPTDSASALLEIEMLYRGYAVLKDAEGKISVRYYDMPEEKAQKSIFDLHQKAVREYVRYRDTLGKSVYTYLYEVLTRVCPESYDANTLEKSYALIESVSPHLTLTQTKQYESDDYTSVAVYEEFYQLAQKGFITPALAENYVPQGLTHSEETGYTYISAYHYNATQPSVIAVIDRAGDITAEYHLYKADGSAFTGHVGGVAVSDKALYVSYGYGVAVIPLDEVTYCGSQKVTLDTVFSIPVTASFLFYGDGMLWAGNFYVKNSNEYPLGQYFDFTTENADGAAYGSYAVCYRLGEDLLPADAADGKSYCAPDAVVALPDRVQGFAYKDGKMILSTSLSSNNTQLYFYGVDPFETDETITLDEVAYPFTVLSSAMLKHTLVALPMGEGIDFTADGCLLFMTESGAIIFNHAYPTDHVWKITLPEDDPTAEPVKLTIRYLDAAGATLHATREITVKSGIPFSFKTPTVSGYYTRTLYVNGKVEADTVVDVVYKEIPSTIDTDYLDSLFSDIACWGDSITEGVAGKSNTTSADENGIDLTLFGSKAGGANYVQVLSTLIKTHVYSGITVNNNGVGGESAAVIAARAGAESYQLYLDSAVTVSTSAVEISLAQNASKGRLGILRQGDGHTINPVTIVGKDASGNAVPVTGRIELSLADDAPEGTNIKTCAYSLLKYTFHRTDGGEQAVTFDANTKITTAGSYLYDGQFCIIFMGQNGGYMDAAELIRQQEEMLASLECTENYLIISPLSGTAESRVELEKALKSRWGDKYINMGTELTRESTYKLLGLSDEVIAGDAGKLASGTVSSLFTGDGVHPTALGYAALGNLIFERMADLGYFDAIFDYYDSLSE